MGEIKITYETLFDILRREKSREELQKLEPDFFQEVLGYLGEKTTILEQDPGQMELFAAKEREKTRIQMQNIRKILKELFEKRENKIIKLSLDRVRTGSGLISTAAMLEEERKLFDDLSLLLSANKRNVLDSLLSLKTPAYPGRALFQQIEKKEQPEEVKKVKTLVQVDEPAEAEEKEAMEQPKEQAERVQRKMVRFIHPVPRFVGRELEVYGPFDEDEVTNLPDYIADLLVKKGRAEEISG